MARDFFDPRKKEDWWLIDVVIRFDPRSYAVSQCRDELKRRGYVVRPGIASKVK